MGIEVSVIIASYNIENYIERAVNSALAQQGVKLEVIVVDDCSTDATWDSLSKITDPRVRTRRNHENCGPSVTRNEAIAMANGKWIAVLDGDDQFLPDRLMNCLALARKMDGDIVVDNIEIQREADGKAFSMFSAAHLARRAILDLPSFIDGNRLFGRGYALGYLKPIFSADFLREHELAYDPSLRIGEDYVLLAEALAQGALCAIDPDPGYVYTVRAGSISHRLVLGDIERMQESDQKFLAKYRLDERSQKAQARRSKSQRMAYYFTLLVDALKHKDVMVALQAVLACPGAVLLLRLPLVARLKKAYSVASKALASVAPG